MLEDRALTDRGGAAEQEDRFVAFVRAIRRIQEPAGRAGHWQVMIDALCEITSCPSGRLSLALNGSDQPSQVFEHSEAGQPALPAMDDAEWLADAPRGGPGEPGRRRTAGGLEILAAPIIVAGQEFGAFVVGRRRGFAAEDEDLAALFAAQAAVALRNDMLRRRVQEQMRELQAERERFHLLVEGIQDYAIFTLDAEGRVVSWTSAAERITGYTNDEIAGVHCSFFYLPEEAAEGAPARDLAAAAETGRHEARQWRRRKDGTTYLANVITTALLDESGALRGYSRILRDVTERRRLEEERERLMAASELQHERERIAMDLHDGVIQSLYAAGLVLDDIADRLKATDAASSRRIDETVDRLNQAVQDIREYVMDLRLPFSDPEDLPEALTALVEETREASQLDASLDMPGEFRSLTQAEALAFFHVAQEAVNNAIKHSRAAAVRLRLEDGPGGLRLEVEDDGIGFDADASRHPSHQGLRNMRRRARAIGADLKVASNRGAGSRIVMTLSSQVGP